MEYLFIESFEIISESIMSRTFQLSGNIRLKTALFNLEQFLMDNDIHSLKNGMNILDSNEDENNFFHFDPEQNFCVDYKMDYSSCNFYENGDHIILMFRKVLKNLMSLYDNLKNTDESKVFMPPPVPVTKLFRIHNPEASNIFDFHNTSCDNKLKLKECSSLSNNIDKIIVDSIHTILVPPNYLDNVFNCSSLSGDRLFNSLDISDSDINSYYELLKVLFGWYFSGYYTGRMELLSQSL